MRSSIAVLTVLALAAAPALPAAERYVALADVEAPNGDKLSTSITLSIVRHTTAEEREALIAALRSGGSAAASAILEQAPDLGDIEIEDRHAKLKYAYAQPMGSGSILIVVAGTPLAHLGSKRLDAEPKPAEGFDLAIATLYLDAAGKGDGELSPAAKLKVRDDGLIAVLDYAEKLVKLRAVERKSAP